MNQPRLFISSSQSDRSLTNRLADYLRRAYDEVWFDENRYGGEAWWDNVLWNIKACDIFLYLLSPASMRSPYCIAEYQEAQRLQKQIVLVAIRPPAPADVQGLPLVDLTPGLTTTKIGELLALIRHLENRPPKPPPTPLSPTPTPVPVGDEPSTRRFPVKLVVLPVLLVGVVLAVGLLAPRVLPLIAPPTSTNTPVPSATSTVTPLPTSTSIPPTETLTSTDTPVPPTATQLPSPTDTSQPPTPTLTPTASNTPTATIPPATFTSTVPPTVTRRRPTSGGK